MSFDLIVLAVILFFSVLAYFRGMIKEIFSLFSFYLAAAASYFFGHWLFPLFSSLLGAGENGSFKKEDYIFGLISPVIGVKALAYIFMYLIVFIIIGAIGFILNKRMEGSELGGVYKISSAAFGALKGFLIILVVYAPLVFLLGQDKMPDWVNSSTSAKVFNKVLAVADDNFDVKEKVQKKNKELKADLQKRITESLGDTIEKSKKEYYDKLSKGVDPKQASEEMVADILKAANKGDSGKNQVNISEEQMKELVDKMISNTPKYNQ